MQTMGLIPFLHPRPKLKPIRRRAEIVEDAPRILDTVFIKMSGGKSKDIEFAVAKSDSSHQEGNHDVIEHDSDEDVTNPVPLVKSGVKFPLKTLISSTP